MPLSWLYATEVALCAWSRYIPGHSISFPVYCICMWYLVKNILSMSGNSHDSESACETAKSQKLQRGVLDDVLEAGLTPMNSAMSKLLISNSHFVRGFAASTRKFVGREHALVVDAKFPQSLVDPLPGRVDTHENRRVVIREPHPRFAFAYTDRVKSNSVVVTMSHAVNKAVIEADCHILRRAGLHVVAERRSGPASLVHYANSVTWELPCEETCGMRFSSARKHCGGMVREYRVKDRMLSQLKWVDLRLYVVNMSKAPWNVDDELRTWKQNIVFWRSSERNYWTDRPPAPFTTMWTPLDRMHGKNRWLIKARGIQKLAEKDVDMAKYNEWCLFDNAVANVFERKASNAEADDCEEELSETE